MMEANPEKRCILCKQVPVLDDGGRNWTFSLNTHEWAHIDCLRAADMLGNPSAVKDRRNGAQS